MASILEDYISEEDLKKFEIKYNDEIKNNRKDPKTVFDYAWCLVRSKYPADVRKGVILMKELFEHGGEEAARRDYVYYLAFGKCKLKEYTEARRYIKAFLEIEPTNRQAQALKELIDQRLTKEGLAGAAIVGAVASVAIGVGLALFRSRS